MNEELMLMIARESGISLDKIKNSTLSADEWIEFTNCSGRIAGDIEYYKNFTLIQLT